MFISIGKVSNLMGLSISTLRRYDDDGILPSSYKTPGGHRRYKLVSILEMTESIPATTEHVVGYARVSGHKQKKELQTQTSTIRRYAQDLGLQLSKVYSDIASGINDKRINFIKMLKSIPLLRPKAVIVTYPDRLSRFGHNIIKLFCDIFDCRLIPILDTRIGSDPQSELVEGVIEVITSYTGRLHRQRRGTFG